MKNKQPSKQLTSPVGIAKFPHLNEPDFTFKKEHGQYSVKLLLDPADAQGIIEALDALYEENVAYQCEVENKKPKTIKRADKPYRMEIDRESGEETGKMEFTFKMNAGGVNEKTQETWTRQPALFDRYGKPMKENIGGGSEIQVAFEGSGYYTGLFGAGITLRLRGVKVHELRTWGNSKESMGFEFEEAPEDDGFAEVAEGSTNGDF